MNDDLPQPPSPEASDVPPEEEDVPPDQSESLAGRQKVVAVVMDERLLHHYCNNITSPLLFS